MSWLGEPQGRTMSELQAGAQVHGGSLPGELLRRKDPWAEAIHALSQTAPEIVQYMKQKQNDAIANTLLQQGGAPAELQGKGATALQMWNQYQSQQPDTAMDDLKYQAAYRDAHPDEFPQGQKPLTPYQQQMMDWRNKKEQRLGSGGSTLKGNFGVSDTDFMDAMRNDRIHRTKDAAGDTHVTIDSQGGMPVEVKENDLNKRINRSLPFMRNVDQAQEAVDRESGTMPKPTSSPSGAKAIGVNPQAREDKQLDKATAMSILQEAGGDKNKARELARSRGYTF